MHKIETEILLDLSSLLKLDAMSLTCSLMLSSVERRDTKLSTVNWQRGTEVESEGDISRDIIKTTVGRVEDILLVINVSPSTDMYG